APLPRVDVKLIDAVRDMHRSRLDEIASRFGVDEQHRHLSIGDTANAIADTVEEHDINIAIVGAVGRNWLQRWLVGSTAEEVFEAVDCDVFVVKLEALGDARGEAPEKAKAIKE
ncbi:MAG TPA: universal stress protein, partial [Woeseiaceae bacterium]|nr:universal stress protein [Woeseiaceae bacterium]